METEKCILWLFLNISLLRCKHPEEREFICWLSFYPDKLAKWLAYSESESHSIMSDSLQPHRIVHRILQAKIPEWVSIPFSRGSSQHRDWTQVSRIAGRFFTSWTREAPEYWSGEPIPSLADLPNPGIEPGSSALQAGSLPTELPGKPGTQQEHTFICWIN